MQIFDSKIDSYIIQNLQKGGILSTSLVERIENELNVTKQAVYKALRSLKKKEIVVERSKLISLNILWIEKMNNFFESTKTKYLGLQEDHYLNLYEGDSIVYRFRDFNTTDIFWGNAFYELSQKIEENQTIYMYNPHEWFFVARKDSEIELFRAVHENGRKVALYSAGDTVLDKKIKDYFIFESQQYYPSGRSLFPKHNYYVNIFEDYVIEVWLDPDISSEIEKFFNTHQEITEYSSIEIQKIIQKKGRNKLKISRNTKKADEIRRKIKKYFI